MASGPEVQHYHRDTLEKASEGNPGNARVPAAPGKGYRECLERGWIEEQTHESAGYRYYAITEAGEQASRAPTAAKPKRAAPRLKAMPDRLQPLPPRLGTLPRK